MHRSRLSHNVIKTLKLRAMKDSERIIISSLRGKKKNQSFIKVRRFRELCNQIEQCLRLVPRRCSIKLKQVHTQPSTQDRAVLEPRNWKVQSMCYGETYLLTDNFFPPAFFGLTASPLRGGILSLYIYAVYMCVCMCQLLLSNGIIPFSICKHFAQADFTL